ncbi:hypothetical protein [Nannocystis sp. SCPEA4]|uniref:hypothetical protein n=1 Tax=Nannocystis sp. SCPEA4 TaxID=2996787 RepID=UPI0022705C06|nr:hypothetical protein [Nannocystis sp. SCPEA4]MCY1057889.1 hypothetical protein [Nannocystis sp. SCPEA4]
MDVEEHHVRQRLRDELAPDVPRTHGRLREAPLEPGSLHGMSVARRAHAGNRGHERACGSNEHGSYRAVDASRLLDVPAVRQKDMSYRQ